ADVRMLVDQARAEVENAGTLIDEILFLSELESGREVVALGHTNALSVLREVLDEHADSAARAGVGLEAAGDPDIDLPLRPRMLRILAENLVENAIRYAGHGSTFRLEVAREDSATMLVGSGPVPGDADADSGAVHRVERVHEGVVVRVRVERVHPVPVGARSPRDRIAVHVPVLLPLVGDHPREQLAGAEVVRPHAILE